MHMLPLSSGIAPLHMFASHSHHHLLLRCIDFHAHQPPRRGYTQQLFPCFCVDSDSLALFSSLRITRKSLNGQRKLLVVFTRHPKRTKPYQRTMCGLSGRWCTLHDGT